MAKSYVINSFFWGIVSKVIDASIKFISIPFLLAYFGRDDFGLIALATSVNAYLHLLDMGVNTGAIKYFSEWIGQKKYDLVSSVARTSISFYGLIGLVNASILLIVAMLGANFFSISPDKFPMLRSMLLILAAFAVFNWATSVFNQLLTANENMAFIQRINIIRSLLSLGTIFLTIRFKWNVNQYFLAFTIVNSLVIIPNYLKAKKDRLIDSFLPAVDWKNFTPIFKYSLAIIAMGVFQISATKLRPIVLSIFSVDGIGEVADYRILETITIFIISIGSLFISIFIPKTSKLLLANDKVKVQQFAYQATLFTSIICAILCMPFIVCGKDILTLYVGSQYNQLDGWLTIWVVTILFSLHNTPVSSLVLATGKTKMLVYSSAVACITSLILNASLAGSLGVGSAIVGYSVYIVIQMSFYYLYFNSKVLDLNSWLIFKSFSYPTVIAFFSFGVVEWVDITMDNLYVKITAKLLLWAILFIGLLFITKLLTIKRLNALIKK